MLSEIAFRHAVWLFCPAFVLHVTEEWPRFTSWANEHASSRFTRRDYNVIHIAGVFVSVLSAAIVSLFPHPAVVFLFFAFVFAPSVFFNTLFHAGASLLTRTYCPGVITAVLIYVPLFVLLAERAYKESLLTPAMLVVTLLVSGVFHTWEVGHNVFKAW